MARFTDDALLDALLMMRGAGMVDYGRFPSRGKDLDLMRKAYSIALAPVPGVTDKVLADATVWFIQNETEYPSAGAFAKRCLLVVEQGTVQLGVVQPGGRTALVRISASEVDPNAALESACAERGVEAPKKALPEPETPERRRSVIAKAREAFRKVGLDFDKETQAA